MIHHYITHGMVAFLLQIAIYFATNSPFLSAIIPTMFYFLRELYQYYIQGKTHNGTFDYGGALSPAIVNFITLLFICQN